MSTLTKIKHFSDYIEMLPGGRGLAIDDKMPQEAFEDAFVAYSGAVVDGLWLLGDLLTWGERVLGESYAQVLDKVRYAPKTIKDASWVSTIFPPSRRHKLLTFNHHKIVAGLEPKDREELLHEAETEELSTRELSDLKKKRFPSTKAPRKKKASAESQGTPAIAQKATKVTLEECLGYLDLTIAYFEALEPKVKFLVDTKQKLDNRLRVLRKLGRKHDLCGGN